MIRFPSGIRRYEGNLDFTLLQPGYQRQHVHIIRCERHQVQAQVRSRPVDPERQHTFNCIVAGTMLQSVALTAASEGLGTCVRGSIDREAFAKAAGLTAEQKVLISQTIGVLPQ